MSSVDNRIVNMQFNNKQFISGAEDSVQALEGLETAIAGMGDDGEISQLGSAVDQVGVRFGALQVAGVAALATIASQATSTALTIGRDLLGSLTSSIVGAGKQRAIDLQQARFQFRGLGLDVQEVMANALEAVDGTAYGLAEAATVATQFGGSGVKAGEEMTTSLRAISGIAAQTGRSYSEIGQIMTGIAGIGRVTTQDLMQFGVRGLDVTGALADQMGKTQQEIREMVSAGQIDFKTFSEAMNTAFGDNAAKANRTFTGALANMKAALARIGADFWTGQLDPLRDIFNALKEVFSEVQTILKPVSKSLHRVSAAVAESIINFLEAVKFTKLITPIIQGFKNILAPFLALAQAMGEAWLTVFPDSQHKGKKSLLTLARAFELLTAPLLWLAEVVIPKLTPAFVGLFTVLEIGYVAVSRLFGIIGRLGAEAREIGGAVVGGIIEGFQGGELGSAIQELAISIVDGIKDFLGIKSPAAELVPVGTAVVEGIAQGIQEATRFIFESIGKLAGAIVDGFRNLFGGMDALDWTAFFNAILTGGLLLSMRGFFKVITGMAETMTTVFKPMEAAFGLLTESLEVMQTQVKAELIKSIAIAVGVLTASIIALSLLDPKKAAIGLGFMATSIGLLLGAMYGINKINPAGIVAGSVALNLMSTSMVIMAGALAAFAQLDPEKVGGSLTTMAIGLAIMTAAVSGLGALGPAALAGAGGVFIIASAMVALAAALAAFSAVGPEKSSDALVTMAVALGIMVQAVYSLGALGPAALAGAGGIFIVASAMVVLAAAFAAFAATGPEKNSKGLVTMAVAIGIMAVATAALGAIGPAVLAGAGAIYIVSAAMVALAAALAIMGKVGPEKMSQALVTIAVALGIFLAAAAIAAIGPVSYGLGVLAASMLIFGAGVALLGAGLLAGATAFAIFTAVFATGTAVLVSGLTAVIGLLPILAHQLAMSFIVFVQTIAAAAPELREAFGEILAGILGTIRDGIPEWEKTFVVLITSLLRVIRQLTPEFEKTLDKFIKTGLRMLEDNVENYVTLGLAIMLGFLRGVRKGIDPLIDEAIRIGKKLIRGIGDGAAELAQVAGDTLLEFADEMLDYVESAEFQGKVKDIGERIGKLVLEGVTFGLYDSELLGDLKDAALNAAEVVTKTMAGPLGFIISSPSKKAIYWGEMIVAGLVKGIQDNIKYAVGASIQLANAAIAAGNKAIKRAQNESTKRQIAAEKAAAKARLSERQAKVAEKAAEKSPKNKELQEAAKEARRLADKQAKAAQAAQRRADKAAEKVSDVQAFKAADDEGKGDILTERANELSDRAIKKLAEANAAALAAKKASGKERDRLKKEAEKAANEAKRLADASKKASKEANDYYKKSVKDRIAAIKAERKARAEEERFDNATDEEKITILQDRMDSSERRARAAQKSSEALIKDARRLAKTDAAKSLRLLARAERLADKANQSTDEAKSIQEEIERLQDVDNTSSGSNFQLSRSAMEDAASAIDRYTKSLEQAEEAAAAAEPVYQFVQYNTSPVALTDTEVYRQTKNLLSAAEVNL